MQDHRYTAQQILLNVQTHVTTVWIRKWKVKPLEPPFPALSQTLSIVPSPKITTLLISHVTGQCHLS